MRNGLQPNAVWYACMGALVGASIGLATQVESDFTTALNTFTFGEREPSPMTEESEAPIPTNIDIPPVAIIIDPPVDKRVSTANVRRGDTILGLLQRQGVSSVESHAAVTSLSTAFDPRDIRVGQNVSITVLEKTNEAPPALDAVRLKVGPGHDVVVLREEDGSFKAESVKAETVQQAQAFSGTITSSLYQSAVEEGVPQQVLIEMIKLFSYDVDFQRDIRQNDSFEIMFERDVTEDGVVVRNQDIEFASMTLRGDTIKIYAFEHEDGMLNYYNEDGKGIRKALMRTPINGARLSSSFGRRKHPVLGYTKMHRGVDFAAPHGTPIYAAGDGVIEKLQRWSSFGNYIRIRHGDGFSTAYAHMKNFAKGYSVGSRVKQGAVIGYVGTTGRSTGPHLHYEVMRGGTQVNPMKVRFPASKVLEGETLTAFQQNRRNLDRKWINLTESPEMASLNGNGPTTVLE